MKAIPMIKCARCKKEVPIGLAQFLPEIKAYYNSSSLAILHQTEMPAQPNDSELIEKYGVSSAEDLFCEECMKGIIERAKHR